MEAAMEQVSKRGRVDSERWTYSWQAGEIVKPRFGVIRRLYTPSHGTEIKAVADLKDGADYVAAGAEKFKPLEYRSIVSARTRGIANKGMVC
jgi:hypothetical protein